MSFKKFNVVVVLGLLFCFLPISPTFAADFKSEYNIEYFIKDSTSQDFTKASYVVRLTNLQPDKIVSTFSISFPQSFGIGNIQVSDDTGVVIPEITLKDRYVVVSMKFNKPRAGLNEINSLYINFMQKNVFRAKGTIWEILIPTMQTDNMSLKSVIVNLPPDKHNKLSIAKPLPDNVTIDKITWNNVASDSIYAVFGDTQNYALNLQYHLDNPNVYRVYTDIAIPPDTLYQQVLFESLIPQPDLLFSDSDGNTMARYTLNPHEKKDIRFKGYAKIFTSPRLDYIEYTTTQFNKEKYTLFDEQTLWKLNNRPIVSDDIKTIYDFTTSSLSYNFDREIKGDSRMGASQALQYSDQAVCTEYSDLFIATARQNGFFTREIQGYGFASDAELRPIQDNSDVLHSWVEYYDVKKNKWIPIDPTWQDTSHIDYFSSFDLNHITFVIHGKKADYPYPAGSYKSDVTNKDVYVEPVSEIPSIQNKLVAQVDKLPLPNEKNEYFTLKFKIENKGNTSVWNKKISVVMQGATVDDSAIVIDHLLPGESKVYSAIFKPNKSLFYQSTSVDIQSEDSTIGKQIITVPTFVTTLHKFGLPILLLLLAGVILTLFISKRRSS